MKGLGNNRARQVLVRIAPVFSFIFILCLLIGGYTDFAHADEGSPPPPPESAEIPEDLKGWRFRFSDSPELTSSLDQLLIEWTYAPQQLDSFASTHGLELEAQSIKVMVITEDENSAEASIDWIEANGGELIAHYKSWVDAWIPISALEALASLPGINQVREPIPVVPVEIAHEPATSNALTGPSLSQGVAASNANTWHSAGFTGSGVKVAVLDFFKDYTTAQSNGDLPVTIATYGTLDLSSPHGTAVAEIIYDMAPGVDFTFASPGSATQMANYIVNLAAAGNDVISSSIHFANTESGDGTGPISDAINTARNTYGTLYVQAAGNQAQYHWDGTFTDGDGDDIHSFSGPGVDINQVELVEVNQLGYWDSGYTFNLHLRWNSWPTTDQDYDLYLVAWNGSDWVAVDSSENWQDGSQPPTEDITYVTESLAYYGFAVTSYNSTGTHTLDVVGYNVPSFQYNISDRSLVDHATAPASFSVAAVDATSPYPLENYSSWGPTHGPGGAIGGGSAKPRIAAFANVDTWAYGAGGFNGTSAATPHVSGAAAVVLDAYPGYTPIQIMSFLEGRAVDQGDAGYDYKFGAGRLHLGDPPILETGSHDDVDERIQYIGGWGSAAVGGAYQGTLHFSNDPSARVELAVDGSNVILVRTLSSDRGEVDVYVDGSFHSTMDNAFATGTSYQSGYPLMDLGTGVHQIELRNASPGKYMDLDGVRVVEALGDGKYDDTTSAAAFNGMWGQATGGSYYNGTLHYSDDVDARVTLPFEGTDVIVLRTKAPDKGNVGVYIDGILNSTMANEFPGHIAYQSGHMINGLSSGTHVLELRNASPGKYMDFDGLVVLEPFTPDAELDDDHINIAYEGEWLTYAMSPLYGGSFHWTGDDTAKAQFTFTGTTVKVMRALAPDRGDVDVYVDGGYQGTMENYLAGALGFQSGYLITDLTDATHVVELRNASSGVFMDLDGVVVYDPLDVGTYDDADQRIAYNGSWDVASFSGPANDTLHYSAKPDATMLVRFTGDGIRITRTLAPDRGDVDVYVDGVYQTTYSSNSAGILFQQTVDITGLGSGAHTLELRNASPGTYMDVDAFQVLP